jgi:hypothetical protein
VFPHSEQERLNVVRGSGVDELSVIKPKTNPKVVHEDGESCHNSHDTPWSTKLIAIEKDASWLKNVEETNFYNERFVLVQTFVHLLALL